MMRAGPLRHRVQIQTVTETVDAIGGISPVWATTATLWAAVEPLRGDERATQQQIDAAVTHRVRMRHGTDISPKDRLVHLGRTFDIASVLNVGERDKQLEIMCSEQISGA